MKKILQLLFLLIFISGFSQQKSFTIDWDGSKEFATESYSLELPFFSEGFDFNPETGIKYRTQWPSSYVRSNSVQITGVTYGAISQSDLKDLDPSKIPSDLQYKLSNSTARDKNFAYFELSPIIKENGTYKRVLSFSLKYSLGMENRFLNAPQAISNSVLSSGSWYKFYVDKTGVFKLTKSFLASLGANLSNVDPRTIKIYGNGGAMLPFENSANYPFDLQENAIKFIGEEDGVFNDGDYILMYAEGPIGYNAVSNTNINVYTDESCYFLNISPEFGKRITEMNQPSGAPDLVLDTFHDYQFHEVDEYNLAKMGRRWFGDRFDIEPSKTFDFSFPNLVTSEPIQLKVYVAAVAESPTNMQLSVNGSALGTISFTAIGNTVLAREGAFSNAINVSSSDITVGLDYNNNGNPSALGYLDYISIKATRVLNYEGEQMLFKHNSTSSLSGVVQYNLTNVGNVIEFWDVTDKFNVKRISNPDSSSDFSFKDNLGLLKTYITVDPSTYYQPIKHNNSLVENQNIKGTIFLDEQGQSQDIDYLIVAPQIFLSQAERLAQINRDQYNLNVKVLTLDKIYNEFSSGNQDVCAIRNLVKYIYDNGDPQNRIKYLCLFGDASFDYKDRTEGNTNFVPSWHAYSSFNLTNSFVSDDFYGMMGENEGDMNPNNLLDIAVGRILADSPQRAREMVDKIERYHSIASLGSWRNNFVLISDDVDEDWEWQIQQTSDDIGDTVEEEKPFVNVTKIHSDAFLQESSAGGDRYPTVTEAMANAIELGALVVNYFGHGGEDNLAKERIFEKPDINNLRNVCKLNCFVTVTCEFTKFDNPLRETAGEFVYWNPNGGAISLITTTRQIFMPVAVSMNNTLDQYLFAYGTNDYPSIAEALRLTKNNPSVASTEQRRLVFYIGDPALKLTFPIPNIKLTSINDVPITQATDTLKALSKVKLSGIVTDDSDVLINDYNGILSATIYDKPIERQTLGNDGTSFSSGGQIIMDFTTLGEIIFRGQATITNGTFDFEFVVPRDITIPVGNGRVSFYSNTDDLTQDNAGYSFDIKVGGINESAPEDNIGPAITLYLNDESFVSGGITNEDPTLIAILEDDNGINTASGIGHDIVAIIDNDETNPYVLNNYYETDVDVYSKGTVNFPFRDLEPGLHTLTLKAWDVYNNSSTAEIQFVVHDKDQELRIENVLNYPNPFVNYTEFWFNHNSTEPLDVSIQIFTVSGKLIRTLNGQTGSSDCCDQGGAGLSRSITWDGRDDFGDRIGKGVYVYKLTVKSPTLNKKVEKFEKLVIL